MINYFRFENKVEVSGAGFLGRRKGILGRIFVLLEEGFFVY